jgi:hypothetical protein
LNFSILCFTFIAFSFVAAHSIQLHLKHFEMKFSNAVPLVLAVASSVLALPIARPRSLDARQAKRSNDIADLLLLNELNKVSRSLAGRSTYELDERNFEDVLSSITGLIKGGDDKPSGSSPPASSTPPAGEDGGGSDVTDLISKIISLLSDNKADAPGAGGPAGQPPAPAPPAGGSEGGAAAAGSDSKGAPPTPGSPTPPGGADAAAEEVLIEANKVEEAIDNAPGIPDGEKKIAELEVASEAGKEIGQIEAGKGPQA